jgi:hypothetical protein
VSQTQAPDPAAAPQPQSLPARFFGVIFAPRATYAAVAAHPRWLGMFLAVLLITGSAAAALLSTETGREAMLDMQQAQAASYGRPMTQAQIDRMEQFAPYAAYAAPVIQLVTLTLVALVISGITFAVFNAILGGDAGFKQVFSIVVHSGAVLAVLALFTTPLNFVRGSLSSATNLAVFLPFLDETSFVARLLGSIDLVFIWWMLSLAIGLGVLYRKRTGPIAISLLAVYVAIGLIIAAIKTASTGA